MLTFMSSTQITTMEAPHLIEAKILSVKTTNIDKTSFEWGDFRLALPFTNGDSNHPKDGA